MPPELRHDVRLLTTMLGEAIAESGGRELLDDVEALRRATIALRGRPRPMPGGGGWSSSSASLDPARAEQVIRAFTCYFQLVNLAEERQRIRTLRARTHGRRPLEGSIAALGPLATPDAFDDLRIRPVLTAHPTEAKRRAVVEHIWRIGDLLDRLDDARLGAPESHREPGAACARRSPGSGAPTPCAITGPSRSTRFAPRWPCSTRRSSPPCRSSTARWTGRSTRRAAACRHLTFPAFLRWGTWVGGDRDGNPTVTAETTTEAVADRDRPRAAGSRERRRAASPGRSRSATRRHPRRRRLRRALARDERVLARCRRASSRASCPTPPTAASSAWPRTGSRRHVPEAVAPTTTRRSSSPTSTWCNARSTRVARRGLAWGELQHLRWQAETFGFHLAEMEVRQHAEVFDCGAARARAASGGDARALDRLARAEGGRPPRGEDSARRARCSPPSGRSATSRTGSARRRASG